MEAATFVCDKCGKSMNAKFSGVVPKHDKLIRLKESAGYGDIYDNVANGTWGGRDLKMLVCSKCLVEHRELLLRHDHEVAEFYNFDLVKERAEQKEFFESKE